jgi:hypothetical protein
VTEGQGAPAPNDTPAGDEAETDQTAEGVEPPPRAGNRRRKRLAEVVAEESSLSGSTELIKANDYHHRVVLDGPGLTSEGGPATTIVDLVHRVVEALKELMPTAIPHLKIVRGFASIQIDFYAPQEEIAAAEARRQRLVDDEDDEDPGPMAWPDTSLAVAALARVVAEDDARAAARTARRISQGAANEIRELALSLRETNVSLDLGELVEGAEATPDWSSRVVEELDRAEELPPAKVRVLGVLQGANSGGEGTFELVSDPDRPLPPELGRRRPGDPIRGTLTTRARREIRAANLWDRNVEARLEVTRRRLADGAIRQEGVRLLSVKPRFRSDEPAEDE